MKIEKKSKRKKAKNRGHGLSLYAINTPGRLKVKQSTSQFILWANGMMRYGTTYGKYGQTKGPSVIPYIINNITLNTRIATAGI